MVTKIRNATTVLQRQGMLQATVQNIRAEKNEVEILCGSIRARVKISELSVLTLPKTAQTAKDKKFVKKEKVSLSKNLGKKPMPTLEINVIGLTVLDALPEVEAFLDSAVIANLDEVRIVHGMGTGKLRQGIHEYLKKSREFCKVY